MAVGIKTGGRQKGTPNKVTTALREAILAAADEAGGAGGTQAYLLTQAKENPTAFMTLLGKVLPTELAGAVTVSHEMTLKQLGSDDE